MALDEKDLTPTTPFQVAEKKTLPRLLEEMRDISFQGRNLGQAFDIWRRMLSEDVMIFAGLAGAMLAGGMREIVAFLIRERYIDCLVSTGANLFHDVYESLGKHHYVGNPDSDDVLLHKKGLDRIYDTYALEQGFREVDTYILNFSRDLKRH
jgi:deoxyhypusine synthase